jgi:hypothetical protein
MANLYRITSDRNDTRDIPATSPAVAVKRFLDGGAPVAGTATVGRKRTTLAPGEKITIRIERLKAAKGKRHRRATWSAERSSGSN